MKTSVLSQTPIGLPGPARDNGHTASARTFRPICPEHDGCCSSASVAIESGGGVTLWGTGSTVGEPAAETKIELQPDQCAVIGRQEGGENEYLDPRFSPTQMVPNTGQKVVAHAQSGPDLYVSRGHFTLRGAGHGIVLVNGVPRRGGGIRPPLNWTIMLSPDHRYMGPGEEVLIKPGNMVRIQLPNSTVVAIKAN